MNYLESRQIVKYSNCGKFFSELSYDGGDGHFDLDLATIQALLHLRDLLRLAREYAREQAGDQIVPNERENQIISQRKRSNGGWLVNLFEKLVKAFRLSMKYSFVVNKICKHGRVYLWFIVGLAANGLNLWSKSCLKSCVNSLKGVGLFNCENP